MLRRSRAPGADFEKVEKASPERAMVLLEEASDAMTAADYSAARELYALCLKIYRTLSMKSEMAGTLLLMAACLQAAGDDREALAYFDEAAAAYRAANDWVGLTGCLLSLGWILGEGDNFDRSRKAITEAVEIADRERQREPLVIGLYLLTALEVSQNTSRRQFEDLRQRTAQAAGYTRESLALADSAMKLAKACAHADRLQDALPVFEESIRFYRGSGYMGSLVPSLLKTGRLAFIDGRPELFEQLTGACLELFAACERKKGEPAALRSIGSVSLRLGDTSNTAYTLFKESLERSRDAAMWRDRAASYAALGCFAFQQGHEDLARSLFDRGFTVLKENAQGTELMEQMLKLSRRVLFTEDLNAAALYFARCAAASRSQGEIDVYIRATYFRGCIANLQGDFTAASRILEECLIYYAETSDNRRLGRALTEKGFALYKLGETDKARTLQRKALATALAEKDSIGELNALDNLGRTPTEGGIGNYELNVLDRCVRPGKEGLQLEVERSLQRGCQAHLADALLQSSAALEPDACRLYLGSIGLMAHESRLAASIGALEGCAQIAIRHDLIRPATRLLGKAAALRARLGISHTEKEALMLENAGREIRTFVTAEEYEAESKTGAGLDNGEILLEAWSVMESFAFAPHQP